MIQAPPRTILEVFESLPEGTLCQIIQNQLVMTPAPDFWHQEIVTEIAMQLRSHAKKHALGKVVVAPVDVYLNETNVYQPDILFISKDRLHLVQNGKVRGAPDLVVEVLSPGTKKHDQKWKKAVYESSGVQEYWIVDPTAKTATGYQLTDAGFAALPAPAGTIASRLLGVTISF